MDTEQLVISQTEYWVKSVIVELTFCPFAKRELERNSIRYRVVESESAELCLQVLMDECEFLDENKATETTLLIFPKACSQFDDYLLLLDVAEKMLVKLGYNGTYQLASFHPDYLFADSDSSDAANYTNRSPYPMLHIIRESSVEKALQHYPDAELIPERNVAKATSLGLDEMKAKLDACYRVGKN